MHRIGVDVGGTKIHTIALDATNTVIYEHRIATPGTYRDIVRAVAAEVTLAGDGTIGIGAPGSQSSLTGLWRNSNIVACNDQPFHRDLEAAIRRPIRTGNDANCFALAEATQGAGRGHDIVLFITLGTGLGGGLVMHGR
jgi:fructokinase